MEEEKYMRRCIQLAQNGLCNAAPNPMVGAVIVCDGKIIGEVYHVRCGEAHAEVNAIRSVKDPSLLKRSTIYVLSLIHISPGGITIKGINELEHQGFSSAIINAIKASK